MTRQEHLEFSILVRLERDGMESLTQWADEQAQAEGLSVNFRKSLLNRTAAILSRHDGQFAADWATAYAETEFAQRVLNGVANGWVLREGDVTMRWLANLPDNEARADVIGQAYKFWLKQRREPAMDWAAGAGEKQVLEPILASYSLALAETDPKAAVDVASRISGLEARTDALVKVAQLWYGNDPGPATAWLEQSALDGEHRELVTNPPQKKKKKRPGVNRDR